MEAGGIAKAGKAFDPCLLALTAFAVLFFNARRIAFAAKAAENFGTRADECGRGNRVHLKCLSDDEIDEITGHNNGGSLKARKLAFGEVIQRREIDTDDRADAVGCWFDEFCEEEFHGFSFQELTQDVVF
ncbi:hypothetical protein [Roseobacter litoralis]|uniref:hypothetical protein n=1 Tax=Roseobacter litoralis TaxID=42443 RepID=UPI002495735E|nr:hypothetical protein [Roseobacter litoralis]